MGTYQLSIVVTVAVDADSFEDAVIKAMPTIHTPDAARLLSVEVEEVTEREPIEAQKEDCQCMRKQDG